MRLPVSGSRAQFPATPTQQAPINPSDMNTIEGKYPLRPDLPGVPGHEGMGVVEAVGPRVSQSVLRDESAKDGGGGCVARTSKDPVGCRELGYTT